MSRTICYSLVTAVILFFVTSTSADILYTEQTYSAPVGEHVHFLQEQAGVRLSPASALVDQFEPADRPVLNFGIGAQPVWLKLDVRNDSAQAQSRQLLLEVSWLDSVNAYWFRDGRLLAQEFAGDREVFPQPSVVGRNTAFEYVYDPGVTTVLLRVESVDPMSLPLYFLTPPEARSRTLIQGYSYGLLYGAILSLLVYNMMLFAALKESRYLYFSVYLGSFIAGSIAYTGHGLQIFWLNSVYWQQYANPVLMTVFNVSGLAFALRFLEVKSTFPVTYKLIVALCLLVLGLQAIALLTGAQQGSLLLAFALMLAFSSIMILLGVMSWRAGTPWARYFLFAAIAGALGSTVTACAVLGLIPFSTLTYRAIDIGMTLDIVLLAFALADQYRVNEKAKIRAEALARVDYMTGLNNRRAFYEQTETWWQLGLRHEHAMSVILFDVDHFKSINDRFGHGCGDEVLIWIAQVLAGRVRASDVVARWGGEEFIVFLPETSLQGAISLAEEIRLAIGGIQWPEAYMSLSVSASFGVAHRNASDTSLDEIISRADSRLYAAKNKGRDQVCADGPQAFIGALG